MIIIITVVSLFIIIVIASSFGKTRAFPEELKTYYPYQSGQTIFFCNDSNKIMKLCIEEVSISKSRIVFGKNKYSNYSEMRFNATAYFVEESNEMLYPIKGRMVADYYYLHIEFQFFGMPSSWNSRINPYSPGKISIIGDSITLSNGTVIMRNIGVVQFRDENTTWYLTK